MALRRYASVIQTPFRNPPHRSERWRRSYRQSQRTRIRERRDLRKYLALRQEARISQRDGHVIGWIDLTGLLPSAQKIDAEAVLNGIAYDSQRDRLFVTGKEWPTIFEIKIVHRLHEQHHSH